MFEPSFLGLNTPWLESQVLVAEASAQQPILGLEIFALGVADPKTFQKPLDQYHQACHAGDAKKITETRRQIRNSILSLHSDQWSLVLGGLRKLVWPLEGGMMATPLKSMFAEEGTLDFTEGLKRVTIARGKEGIELIKAGKLDEGIAKLGEMVTAWTKISSYSDLAELARFLEAMGDFLKEFIDQEGEDLETILNINEQVVRTWNKIYGIALGIYDIVSKMYSVVATNGGGDQLRVTFKIDLLEQGMQVLTRILSKTPPHEIARSIVETVLNENQQIVIFTGAGVSQESGVPTFQESGFRWEGRSLQEWDDPDLLRTRPQEVLRFFDHARSAISELNPNDAHRSIAELEKSFPDQITVVTQNVDGLHQRAGSKNVFEVHGNLERSRCMHCQAIGEGSNCQQCGGLLRPDVTLMGEPLNSFVLAQARERIKRAKLLIVVGTSATVWPVAGLIEEARSNGATIIQVDRQKNAAMKPDVFVEGKAGTWLPEILDF